MFLIAAYPSDYEKPGQVSGFGGTHGSKSIGSYGYHGFEVRDSAIVTLQHL